MEQYKLINAQLIGQVQSQRLLISKLQETEVLLKRKLMEAHEEHLAETQYNENKLKIAIRHLLDSLDLNADININFTNTRPSQSRSQSKSSENGRSTKSSSRICSEFRRSSVLLERSVPISPSRNRRSPFYKQIEAASPTVKSPTEAIHTKTPDPRHLNELHMSLSSTSSPIENQLEEEEEEEEHQTETVLSSPAIEVGLISIIEESDNEDNTLSSTGETDESSEHIIISEIREESSLPLRDVTNTTARPSPKNPKLRKSPACSQNVERKRDKSLAIQKQHESSYENLEPSIELVRQAPYQRSPTHLTVPSLTPRRSHLSFSAFNPNVHQNGGCSTPRLEQQTSSDSVVVPVVSKAKPKKTKITNRVQDVEEQSSSEITLSGRPSRSCRPKSLKEPSNKAKLRNETATKR